MSGIYKEIDSKKLTLRDEKEIVRMVIRNRTISIREIQHALLQAEIEISIMIIQRVIKDAGIHVKVEKKGKHINEKNLRDRIKFAREHSRWNLDNWRYMESCVNSLGMMKISLLITYMFTIGSLYN
jgi:hypothetical protein